MNIALLGAGHIGQAIARLLHDTGDYDVTVADADPVALSALSSDGIATSRLDGAEPGAIAALLRGRDAVVNALPYHLATTVAGAARGARCHYFDLTEDVAATTAIRRLADGAPVAFMPQCGLAPGFVGVVAHHLAAGFEQVHDVKMRVGALPVYPTNALKYNLTWSVDGLINEYCHPCDCIRDGRPIEALPLEGLEHFSLDGTEYEAFNTSGGLGTLCDTLAGKVRNLDYKTVRYPGHRDLMAMLLDDLRLKDEPETLKAILRRSTPATLQDVVLVFVTVSGMRGGRYLQEVYARKIFADGVFDDRHEIRPLSAIQITTAAGICAAVDLFREGALPDRGFIRQEQMALPAFLDNRFGRPYRRSRAVESAARA